MKQTGNKPNILSGIALMTLFVVAQMPPTAGWADPASPPGAGPVIFLSDNLDEPAGFGFCIDTVGRGRSDKAHAHSCKPRGDDVNFRFDPEGRIQSAAFPDLCLARSSDQDAQVDFLLNACNNSNLQKFAFDTANGEIRAHGQDDLCLTVNDATVPAGPFVKRELELSLCASTPAVRKQWSVRP